MVLQGGTLKQQILAVEAPVDQDELSMLARQLTDNWKGLTADEIGRSTIPLPLDTLGRNVFELVVDTMRRIDARRSSDVYRDGLLNTLNQPEFRGREGIEQIVRAIEERQLVEQLVAEALQQAGVKIIIGGEGKWEDLSEVGIVIARYGVGDQLTGAMGVLGPVRMPYERTVSVVRYMSRLMSDLMSDLYN